MKAIDFDTFGAPEVLTLVEVPEPTVRPHDLLVKVHAAGVNRADLLLRTGHYGRPDFGDSHLVGLEAAGEVVAIGSQVQGYKVGDRVMGITGGGAYAEYARLDYRMAMPVPDGLDYVHAAAIPEVFVTAHEALINLGRLKPGETVLSMRRRAASARPRCSWRAPPVPMCLPPPRRKRPSGSARWARTW